MTVPRKDEETEATSSDDAASRSSPPPPDEDARNKTKESKSEKKKKKSKRKKKRRREEDGEEEEDPSAAAPAPAAKPTTKEERRAARRDARAAAAAEIPAVDPATGVPFGKAQLRRMRRRVKHGLSPIASVEEEREIREREARERREEERLYAASGAGDEEEDEEAGEVEEDAAASASASASAGDGDRASEGAEDGASADDAGERAGEEGDRGGAETKERKRHNPPSKGTKRAKSVPPDYVCRACGNDAAFPPHWIYDCPKKVTTKGCNTVAKRLRGLHDPPSRKVFVSGLPFDTEEAGVRRFFEKGVRSSGAATSRDGDEDENVDLADSDLELVHLKLLKFEDSKRCKGQAFLTFASDGAARRALRLNGAAWEEAEAEAGAKKRKKRKTGAGDGGTEEGGEKKKALRLKVTKVLNRSVTKKQGGGGRARK